MKKKLLALFLVLALVVCSLPTAAFAEATQSFVRMYGTRNKPANGYNTQANYYYSYYTDTQFWVGWRFKTSGKPVYMVQAYLFADDQFSSISDVDGYFGNRTEQAIRDYQAKYGLDSDGVAGGDTWKHMAFTKYGTSITYLLPYSPTAS